MLWCPFAALLCCGVVFNLLYYGAALSAVLFCFCAVLRYLTVARCAAALSRGTLCRAVPRSPCCATLCCTVLSFSRAAERLIDEPVDTITYLVAFIPHQ